jgi:uncharacterized membrane protein YraQ (UPF0718 family)
MEKRHSMDNQTPCHSNGKGVEQSQSAATSHCCHEVKPAPVTQPSCCHTPVNKADWLLRTSGLAIIVLYLLAVLAGDAIQEVAYLGSMAEAVFNLVNTMWWGVLIGILMIAVLGRIPREFIMTALGTGRGVGGILRATAAGVLLDLCSHGILMVGAKLYERGAGIGQVMAFLVASPWNSFSLTLVLVAMIGLPRTLAFIVLSMVIAVITGMVFESLVGSGLVAGNPNSLDIRKDFHFWQEAMHGIEQLKISPAWMLDMLMSGLKESRMVLRWIFFGIILASLVRTFINPENFSAWFGPSLAGLGLTVLVATIMEVCSEGSTPIAADLLTRAGAPGNSFTFLMTGVSTDYTEVMVLKETTGSWKTALLLPLITVPQVITLGLLLNTMG